MTIHSKELLYKGDKEVDFVRPDLTSNTTWGGNNFGVKANVNTTRAYRAVDGNISTYWETNNYTTPIYRFYNPKPIKITSLQIACASTVYVPASVTIKGNNNDYSTYEDLGGTKTLLSGTYTIDLSTNTKYYKYYALELTLKSASVRIAELVIKAKEK